MPFLILIFLILIAIVGYFAQLNPNRVAFYVTRDQAYEVSLTSLILFSAATGGLLVMISSGVRQTRALYLNWTYRKRQKKEAQTDSLYKEGLNAFFAKRNKEALLLFQKVLAIHPNHIPTLLRLGEIHRLENNVPEAIRLHRMARLADDKNVEAQMELAKDYEATLQWDEAIGPLKELVHKDETNAVALIPLRDIYIRLCRWEEAHLVAEKILKLPLSNEMRQKEQDLFLGIQFEKGKDFLERNQIEAARRAFKSGIKTNKKFIPAYIGLGEAYLKEGRIESAMTFFEKGYDITQNLILLHRLEEICLGQGQPDRILSAYQKALGKNPHHLALKFFLGKLYFRLEMVDEAFDLLFEIEGQIESFPDLHKILGNLYLRRGESRLAAEAFRRGLGLKEVVIVPYYCLHCDYRTTRWSGRCAKCGQWNSYEAIPIIVEKGQKKETASSGYSLSPSASLPRELL